MKTFLLVAQEAQTREVVKSMIQKLGHYVVAVPDALTAQQIMSYVLFDAVCTAYDDSLITDAERTTPPTRVVLLLDKQFDSEKSFGSIAFCPSHSRYRRYVTRSRLRWLTLHSSASLTKKARQQSGLQV